MKIKHPLYNKEDQNKGISGAQENCAHVLIVYNISVNIYILYGWLILETFR
jgi:hypothetical protein